MQRFVTVVPNELFRFVLPSNVTDNKLGQLNESVPIEVTVSGIVIEIIPVP